MSNEEKLELDMDTPEGFLYYNDNTDLDSFSTEELYDLLKGSADNWCGTFAAEIENELRFRDGNWCGTHVEEAISRARSGASIFDDLLLDDEIFSFLDPSKISKERNLESLKKTIEISDVLPKIPEFPDIELI